MFTSDSLNETFFRDFKSYFENARKLHPHRWRGDNHLVFFQEDRPGLEGRMTDLGMEGGCREKLFSFAVKRNFPRRILTRNCSAPEKELDLRSFLQGEFFHLLDDFEIYFLDWNFAIFKRGGAGDVQTIYQNGKGETRVVLFERNRPGRLFTELFYICSTCGRDRLTAAFSKEDGLTVERYYQGFAGKPLSAFEFFEIANNHYLGWLYRRMGTFLNEAQSVAGWPRVK